MGDSSCSFLHREPKLNRRGSLSKEASNETLVTVSDCDSVTSFSSTNAYAENSTHTTDESFRNKNTKELSKRNSFAKIKSWYSSVKASLRKKRIKPNRKWILRLQFFH